MNFTTPYTHDRARSFKVATVNDKPSLTQQSDASETDINVIVARYTKTGQLPQIQDGARWGDFSEVNDYRSALDRITELKAAFYEIPAAIRDKFDNDPAKFCEFAENPDNVDEMVKMGLATPKENPETREYTASRRAYDDNTGLDDDHNEPSPPPPKEKNGNPATGQRPAQNGPTRTVGQPPRGGA